MTDYTKAFIYLFRTPRCFYFYDVNTDSIVPITEEIYCYLDKKINFEELSEKDKGHLEFLKDRGYLSEHHLQKIRHPDTDKLDYMMGNKCELLLLQVTQSCNLTCGYCPYASSTVDDAIRKHSGKKMSWDVAKKSIDFFAEHTKDMDQVGFGFYGGEPIVAYEIIQKSVEYIKTKFLDKRQIDINVVTNGTLLTDEMIDFFAKNKVRLTFSIDGPESIHDINRKKPDGTGSYKVAYGNLLKAAKIYGDFASEGLHINMTINPENSARPIIDFYNDSLLEETGIGITASAIDDDELVKKYIATEEYRCTMEYERFLGLLYYLDVNRNIHEPKSQKSDVESLKQTYTKFKTVKNEIVDISAPGGPCLPGVRRLFVDVDGNFFPCEKVNENSQAVKLGSIEEGYDIEKARKMLNVGELTEEKCKNCYAIWHCVACVRNADDGDSLSGEKKIRQCSRTYSLFESDLKGCALIREIANTYRRRK